jgi:hypothetical protein
LRFSANSLNDSGTAPATGTMLTAGGLPEEGNVLTVVMYSLQRILRFHVKQALEMEEDVF